MRNIWILGLEYARQQKVMLIVFAFWIVGFDVLITLTTERDRCSSLAALFTQQCVYGMVFTIFMAAAVIHNERNSRRILAVMSKGVSRAEYLAAHILGIGLLAVIYFAAATLLFTVISRSIGYDARAMGLMLAGLLAALVATTVTLAFAAWLHPLLAAALTMFLLSAPMLVLGRSDALVLSPVAYFVRESFTFDSAAGWTGHWAYWPIGMLEVAGCWLIATLIFERQDVAVPTE